MPKDKKETKEQKIERGAKDFAERFEGVMKDLAEEQSKCDHEKGACPKMFDSPKNENEDWEKELLGDLRVSFPEIYGVRHQKYADKYLIEKVKSLISKTKEDSMEFWAKNILPQTVETARQELKAEFIKKIMAMMKEHQKEIDSGLDEEIETHYFGRLEALEDLLNNIKKDDTLTS